MPGPLPLWAALLAAGASPATVTAVHLDVPAAERARLERYVEIVPGDPFDAAAVRHAVELLHATGDFEDVVVEAVSADEGMELTFRPVLAPLLRVIEVEGHPRLPPRRVYEVTRLRAPEPLWSSRLDRAAQDLALALAADGWLEARVVARARRHAQGADAVFEIASGPRVRVGEVHVTGLSGPRQASFRGLARPRPGTVFRRDRAEAAAERMTGRLRSEQHWRARVDLREVYDPRAATVDLTFHVQPGPWTGVEFNGPLPGGVQGELLALLREGALAGDVLEEARDRAEEALRGRGYRSASVSYAEQTRPGGIVVVYEVRPGPLAMVSTVLLTGAGEHAHDLRPLLGTRDGAPLLDEVVEDDARVLTRALEERGFVSAEVQPVTLSADDDTVLVEFRVRPGAHARIETVRVRGDDAELSGVSPRLVALKEGEPYRARDLAAARNGLLAAYRNAGYLDVQVVADAKFSNDGSQVQLELKVNAGPRTLVDHVVIAGLDHTHESVVRRALTVSEGDPLGLEAVLDSQRRLAELGIFSRTSVRELDPESVGHRSLLVSVAEGPRTAVAYGVGYAERELLRGSIEVTRRNLFGRNRSLTLYVRGSLRGSRVLASYRDPYVSRQDLELTLSAFREQESREQDGNPTFDYARLGALAQVARVAGRRTSVALRLSFQETDLSNVRTPLAAVDRQYRTTTVSGPSASVVHDTRDDPFDPRRGRFLVADVQLSQAFLGGESFVKSFFQASGYQPLGAWATLALNARLGLARTLGDDRPQRLPLPDRFFAGGDYGLRGFETDGAGPAQADDSGETFPTGGNAMLLGAAELRFDATRQLSVAVFSDIGNVFETIPGMALSELRYTAGIGLRYKSALGPLRVDWGYKLDRREGEAPSRLHFTVGHAF